jgi:hypothetical protein
MVLEERPPAEIQAQAERVAAVHRELTEARVEAREAEAAAAHEQAQAHRAARAVEDAESGRVRPVAVAEAVAWHPPREQGVPVDLRDRLG